MYKLKHRLYLDEPLMSFALYGREPSIVWEDRVTEQMALRYAHGDGQRAMIDGWFWNVDREPAKLRQRLEDAGFTFDPIDTHRDGTHIYRIYKPKGHPMTGDEMKAIRSMLGLSAVQLGRAFGYGGGDATISVMISKYENGSRPIPTHLVRLLLMYQRHGVPDGWTSKLHDVIAERRDEETGEQS